MALLTKTGNYIKINLDGSYLVYNTLNDRKIELKKINSQTIINKYKQLLAKAIPDEERSYYDPEAYKEYNIILDEFHQYMYNLYKNNITETYPIMHQYHKTVEKTIPKVIASGKLPLEAESLTEIYNKTKNEHIFGEVEDI